LSSKGRVTETRFHLVLPDDLESPSVRLFRPCWTALHVRTRPSSFDPDSRSPPPGQEQLELGVKSWIDSKALLFRIGYLGLAKPTLRPSQAAWSQSTSATEHFSWKSPATVPSDPLSHLDPYPISSPLPPLLDAVILDIYLPGRANCAVQRGTWQKSSIDCILPIPTPAVR
jgi:hypothetical protein